MATKKTPTGDKTAATDIIPQSGPASPANGDLHGGQKRFLTVRAPMNGYRRAGRAWSATETTVPADEFTPAQKKALRDDPRLVVVVSSDS
jgi:hypothetical protein